MASSDIPTQKQKFDAVFEFLLTVDAKFLPVVQRKLSFYGLYDIGLFEIVNDVYLRGIKAIEKGQIIENPKAWCRRVAFNVIFDKMRNQYKEKEHPIISLDAIEYTDDIEYEIAYQNSEEDAYFYNEVLRNKLLRFRDELNEEDQMIFYLRFMEDLSWKEVKKHLVNSGINRDTATLRKRGERIKKRLKQFLLGEN